MVLPKRRELNYGVADFTLHALECEQCMTSSEELLRKQCMAYCADEVVWLKTPSCYKNQNFSFRCLNRSGAMLKIWPLISVCLNCNRQMMLEFFCCENVRRKKQLAVSSNHTSGITVTLQQNYKTTFCSGGILQVRNTITSSSSNRCAENWKGDPLTFQSNSSFPFLNLLHVNSFSPSHYMMI